MQSEATTRTGLRHSFTLFEILIVISIIAIAIGWMGIQIPKALQKEKFERGVEEVVGKISLAQEIMLDYGCDLTLSFTIDGTSVFCNLSGTAILSERVRKLLQAPSLIQGVETIEWEGSFPRTLPLYFNGGMGATPQGTLRLTGHGNVATLYLQGYPAKILKNKNVNEEKKIKAPYPTEKFPLT